MSLALTTINWDATAYTAEVKAALEAVVKYGANMTAEDASRILERIAPDSTGMLASQIKVKASKFPDGGYYVEAQGPGDYKIVTSRTGKVRRRYYASFVELGTKKMVGRAYLRKALRKNKFRMRAMLRKQFGEVRG